jgi:hypothetical protein
MRVGLSKRLAAAAELGARRLASSRQRRSELKSLGTTPSLGDVLELELGLGHPVGWLLAEVDTREGAFLAVLVDDCPFVGSLDVGQGHGALDGALVARCNHGYWVPRELLLRANRTARVSSEMLAEVRTRLSEMRVGSVDGGPDRESVDTDPEYLAWCQYLDAVVDRLEAKLP